jgi:uncharacterized membrane-anchored protein YjiN (DUF445 family)
MTGFLVMQSQGMGQERNTLVDEILRDVIEYTQKKANEVIQEKIGQSLPIPSYEYSGQEEPEHESGKDLAEIQRELAQLDKEYERKLTQLNKELDRKLKKYESEFQRESENEDKPDKIKEKRAKLEWKVDKAYDKFNRKVEKENSRYLEKRDRILSNAQKGREDNIPKSDKGKGKGKDKRRDSDRDKDEYRQGNGIQDV